MANPIPNSPEFAKLTDCQKLRILAERWIAKYGPREIPTLISLLTQPETEEPKSWYYEPNAKKALEEWSDKKTQLHETWPPTTPQ